MPLNVNVAIVLITLLALFSATGLASDDITGGSDKALNHCLAVPSTVVMVDKLAKSNTEKHFQILGKAKFSFLFWDVYESQLLTSDGHQPFSNICQYSLFEINYLRDISQKELIDNTVEQWRHLAFSESTYSAFLPLLRNIWPDIKAGDQLAMLNQAGTTIFYLNQQKIGGIVDATFAKVFLSIWLDENTSEPKLRKKLLGDNI